MPPKHNAMITKSEMKQLPENCKDTHFTKKEVVALLKMFYKINSGYREMKRDKFRVVIPHHFYITDDLALDRIYHTFSILRSGKGHKDPGHSVSPEQWIKGLSILLFGTLEEQIAFSFDAFNLSNDGYMNRDQIQTWLKNAIHKSHDEDQEENDRDLAELCLRLLNPDPTGRVTVERYAKACEEEGCLLEVLGNIYPKREAISKFMEEVHGEKGGES